LVTGGAGFIGCSLSAELVSLFPNITVIDNLHPQIHARHTRPEALDQGCELVVGDVCDPAVWDDVLPKFKPDVIIHLAAETGTGQSLSEATRHAHTNVVGTTTMLDACMRHGVIPKKFVLASSRAVYGEGAWRSQDGTIYYPGQRSVEQLAAGRWDFDGEPVAMNGRLIRANPVSVYGATKMAQENILSSWANAVGTEYVVLRLQNVFGPGQSLINSYTGIVSLFCQMARSGKSIPLYEDGLVRRDFILIADVASAIIQAIKTEGVSGQVFDIGSGVATTLEQLANFIGSTYGAPAPHVAGKYRFGDVRHAFSDSTYASERLCWVPRYSLEQGLSELIKWIEAQHENV
jgi:dTDP-L-rhamnose 4-epimerase